MLNSALAYKWRYLVNDCNEKTKLCWYIMNCYKFLKICMLKYCLKCCLSVNNSIKTLRSDILVSRHNGGPIKGPLFVRTVMQESFQSALEELGTMMPRDAFLSDRYTLHHCCISGPVPCFAAFPHGYS